MRDGSRRSVFSHKQSMIPELEDGMALEPATGSRILAPFVLSEAILDPFFRNGCGLTDSMA